MLQEESREYHASGRPGKIAIAITKSCATQHDLALAYTPGVAAPVREIQQDPLEAFRYTARANLVAVVTNGTAVLGLGNVGPLAGKPVMEGNAPTSEFQLIPPIEVAAYYRFGRGSSGPSLLR